MSALPDRPPRPDSVSALVLAGQRGGTDPVARAAGVTHKALVPVGDVPMLLRVVAALRASAGIGRIIVSIEAPEATLAGVAGLQDVTLRPAAAGPAASAAAAFAEFGPPLLITTADHALLTPAMVDHLLAHAPKGADAVAALAARPTVMAVFPATRRTWLRFRGGAFSGCNLFLLGGPGAARVLDVWTGLERDRKRPLAMARRLGPMVLAAHALGLLSLAGALRALGQRCGARLAAVEMPFAAAAVDVDTPSDLALAEAWLAGQQGTAGRRAAGPGP